MGSEQVTELRVNEVFYSIQGEGLQTGTPSVFIRLAGCNLRCSWCDTRSALDGRVGLRFRPLDLMVQIAKNGWFHNLCSTRTHLVFTGGEPPSVYRRGTDATTGRDSRTLP
ncbi:MAG: hypothetical protein ACYTFW_09395 [Planctomycetota bacterium]